MANWELWLALVALAASLALPGGTVAKPFAVQHLDVTFTDYPLCGVNGTLRASGPKIFLVDGGTVSVAGRLPRCSPPTTVAW